MRTTNNFIILFYFLFATGIGCENVPCYPPYHYAPELNAHYSAEEIRIPTPKGYVLAGTLTIPTNSAPPYPAVILVSDSIPQDRDMLNQWSKPYCFFKPFRQIAEALSRGGIAVLRMDDPGVGCSQGGPFDDITLQERAEDVRAGLEFLEKRKDINKLRLGIIGVGEGANIAAIIAADKPPIQAIVMMAGMAVSGWKIKEYQYRYPLKAERLLTDQQIEQEVAKKIIILKQAVRQGKTSPRLRSLLEFAPVPTVSKVTCPVLILQGDKDAKVPANNAHLLAQTMHSHGNHDVTEMILNNYNHLFLKDSDGRISHYEELLKHEHQLSEDLLRSISNWLLVKMYSG